MNGTLLMHPIHPEGEGQNYLSYRDINGKAFFQEALNMLKTQDSGWIDYMWPKPGFTKPVKKTSYFRKAKMPDGQTVVVAGGYYIQ